MGEKYTEIQEIQDISEIEDIQDVVPNDSIDESKTLGIYHSDIIPAAIAGGISFWLVGSRAVPITKFLAKIFV